MITMAEANKLLIFIFLFAVALLIALTVQASVPFPRGDLTYSFTVVEIRNNAFVPEQVGVYKNATVVWVNKDPEERYLFVGGERMPVLNYGDTYTLNFHEFGRYDYICGDNPTCRGFVIVR
jgi:plastocyanin